MPWPLTAALVSSPSRVKRQRSWIPALVRTTLGEHFGNINAANLKRAHALLESGKARGKIVLEGF